MPADSAASVPVTKTMKQLADEAVKHGEACVAAYTAARKKIDDDVSEFDFLVAERKRNLAAYPRRQADLYHTLVWSGRLRTRQNVLKHKHKNAKRVLAGLAPLEPIRIIPQAEYRQTLELYKKIADDAYTAYATATSTLGEYAEKPHEQ